MTWLTKHAWCHRQYTHFNSKPKLAFAKDYYYHKSGSYSIVAHVIMDVRRSFIDLYVDSLGSISDS
jgi:hypothetical protein